MVLLGDKFYAKLNKMTLWKQSLFALVLATRQYPNFALWTEIKAKPDPKANQAYLKVLHTCWLYFADRSNHIDLLKASDELDPYISSDPNDQSNGYAYASDCGALLCAALEGIPLGIPYGFDASNASLASVIRLCESKYPEITPNFAPTLTSTEQDTKKEEEEENLLKFDEITNELNFQVELLQKLSQNRSLQLVRELLTFALQEQRSNIGLENPLTINDFPEIFDPRLDEQAKAKTPNPNTPQTTTKLAHTTKTTTQGTLMTQNTSKTKAKTKTAKANAQNQHEKNIKSQQKRNKLHKQQV